MRMRMDYTMIQLLQKKHKYCDKVRKTFAVFKYVDLGNYSPNDS